MLSSMTGFGRAVADAPIGNLIVEIQSVNRKYLEVFISLPKEFSRFEQEVRKWVGESVSRGSVSVRVFLIPNPNAIEYLLPDPEMLKGLKKGWESVAKKVGFDVQEITLSFVMEHLPLQSKQELAEESDLAILNQCVVSALDSLHKMKLAEGKALATDLAKRLQGLEEKLEQIEKLSVEAAPQMRQKLFAKMKEVLQTGPELEERLLREIALYAEKIDIAEEITRFRSHLSQFTSFLKGGIVGRKMDFLIQEMGREVNTIGSKSVEAKIAHLVVEMKSELEKIREQVQNLE
jgi:uncharacterized protein (TIGR00255 family)